MDPTVIGMIVFTCTFGGALFGMWLRTVLPEHHLDANSKDTVKLGVGLIATMTALVLGLVTASSKSSYDAVNTSVKHTAVEVLALDRTLARYGPETAEIRRELQHAVGSLIETIWPQSSSTPGTLDPIHRGTRSEIEMLEHAIYGLKPRDDFHRALRSRALDLTETILQTRWIVLAGTEISVPLPFLVVLLFWLTIIFASFGVFAPKHATVVAVFFFCALSVGTALFLVLEMDVPFSGLLKISSDPLHFAFTNLNQ